MTLTFDELCQFIINILVKNGLSPSQANSVARVMAQAERDGCDSHGIYRLPGSVKLIRSGDLNLNAEPVITEVSTSIVRAAAGRGYSIPAFDHAVPALVAKAKETGIAALAINNCYHFSALWPEVEALAEHGLVSIAMTLGQHCVAPAGGTQPALGTNPFAFGWPRPKGYPFVFDFATSIIARGDIEIFNIEGKPIPASWAMDSEGQPTTDPAKALKGALNTFGGPKGSALSIMIELLAGPMIADLTSHEANELDQGRGLTPLHGELVIACDPSVFLRGFDADQYQAQAERLFQSIEQQGARLPSARRYKAREQANKAGITISDQTYKDLKALLP